MSQQANMNMLLYKTGQFLNNRHGCKCLFDCVRFAFYSRPMFCFLFDLQIKTSTCCNMSNSVWKVEWKPFLRQGQIYTSSHIYIACQRISLSACDGSQQPLLPRWMMAGTGWEPASTSLLHVILKSVSLQHFHSVPFNIRHRCTNHRMACNREKNNGLRWKSSRSLTYYSLHQVWQRQSKVRCLSICPKEQKEPGSF